MNSSAAPGRYTAVAVALHWLVALLVIGNVVGGWLAGWLGNDADPAQKAASLSIITLHKSVGLTILALTLVRLGWRLANPPPPLPAYMTVFERRAAIAVHLGFYLLLLVLPLTGWAMVSSRPSAAALSWFGLIGVPDLSVPAQLLGLLRDSHHRLGWVLTGLVLLHVGAALKHRILDRDNILARMLLHR